MDKVDIVMVVGSTVILSAASISLYRDYKADIRLKKNIAKQVYFTKDLNRDGRDDLISESVKGYKTPLYAVVNKDGSIRYVSGEEMKKTDPTTDYETIEDMLNKK